MPTYLALFKYSVQGAKGFMKEKAAARQAAGKTAYESVGEKRTRSIGWRPASILVLRLLNYRTPLPPVPIAALAHSTGAFTEYRLVQLLATSEIDGALDKPFAYRPPGG